ncbi:membrane protein insertion efficiency factor YidD [Candidatus Woesebacteria bacterium]|nr:membrane protein insertion efficiency factor YidD [Candidatus Woesebacteria bacterium]
MVKRVVLVSIRLYQKTSFFHRAIFKQLFISDAACRFHPTCSEYTYQAVEKYGVLKGLWLGINRIVRCHPWSEGGEDPIQ